MAIARRNKSLRKPANVSRPRAGLPAASTMPGACGPAVAVLRPSALGLGAHTSTPNRTPVNAKRTCCLCWLGHQYINRAALEPSACLATGDDGGWANGHVSGGRSRHVLCPRHNEAGGSLPSGLEQAAASTRKRWLQAARRSSHSSGPRGSASASASQSAGATVDIPRVPLDAQNVCALCFWGHDFVVRTRVW